MEALLNESYTIQTASGCGSIVADMIIGEIGDINRFFPGHDKYAGCSPRMLIGQESSPEDKGGIALITF